MGDRLLLLVIQGKEERRVKEVEDVLRVRWYRNKEDLMGGGNKMI
jgi:hypothetical protein